MKTLLRTAGLAALLATSAAWAGSPVAGRWDAQLIRNGNAVPFRLDIQGEGPTLKGTLYDGFRPNEHTTSASFDGGKLTLTIEHYLTTITADLKDGQLVGNIHAQSRSSASDYDFIATRHDDKAAKKAAKAKAPSIEGSWLIPLDEPNARGERTIRFSVEQRGAEVAASILKVDGDTGAYSGVYKDGQWLLSHYDGSRAGVIVVKPLADGSLEVLERRDGANVTPDKRFARSVAFRPDIAVAKGLAAPADNLAHTRTRDGVSDFTFSFPDVEGRIVTQDDPRFRGKVVLAVITGTWCPNCHDEAQYLVQLDRKYRDKGLAIVALTFEEESQQESLQRARAFIAQYNVQYPYLLAGAPEEVGQKIPQLVNLNTFPASVFVGRDGKVRAIHAGFASLATGEFRAKQDKEFETRIEALLAEAAPADRLLSAN